MTDQAYFQNYINGTFVDGGAGRLLVDNPADGSALAEIALADEGDIDRAVTRLVTLPRFGLLSAGAWCAPWVIICLRIVMKSQHF